MRQQMPDPDVPRSVADGAADNEAGEQVAQGRVEIEPAMLKEQHGRGSRGCDLGHAGDVEDGARLYGWSVIVISQPAQCALQDYLASGHRTKGAAGEGAHVDGL